MRLSGLLLRNFRNLHSQELELPREGLALIGDNAQGKSNFLEAIYYLETLRSFRGARDEQMVAFGEDVFRVAASTQSDDPVEAARGQVTAAFERRSKRKKVSVDGAEPDRMSDALGRLAAVIFSPVDVELVSGGPSERRRFLDIVLSLNEPGYVTALQEFKKVLARRNASLKAGDASSLVSVWDPALVRAGVQVALARKGWIEARAEAFGDYYARVSDGVRATMSYRPGLPLPEDADPGVAEHVFQEALVESRVRERRMGVTVVGPHRDDIRLTVDREGEMLDLRAYGSGGQRRTAALALKLVEAMTIRDRRSQRPLILLDDVFAELDEGRSERVLHLMETEDTGQVVLTAPKDGDVRLRRDSLPRWRIASGRIST